jgi:hypothetical protein
LELGLRLNAKNTPALQACLRRDAAAPKRPDFSAKATIIALAASVRPHNTIGVLPDADFYWRRRFADDGHVLEADDEATGQLGHAATGNGGDDLKKSASLPKAAKQTEQHRPREPSLARLC